MGDRGLLAIGLSSGKIESLRDLAQAVLTGAIASLDEARALDDEAFIERITRVRGVGRRTSQMVPIFLLGREDVLPAGDLGVRARSSAAYGRCELPTPQELEEFGRTWAPYRTVASWYLWRVAEGADDSPQPA